MFKSSFGTKQQITFNNESEYYELLGYLSKSDGSTRLVWEKNNEQGAWGEEGRIEFLEDHPDHLRAYLSHTAGNGNILSRVNCNEFLENLDINHHFVLGASQDINLIRSTVPKKYVIEFDEGLKL
jgi:hypothetical protein